MPLIYCLINEFDRMSKIYVKTDNAMAQLTEADTSQLASVLPPICEQMHTDTLHLFGSDQYISGIVETIRLNEKTMYNGQKLKIEVN